MIVPFLYFCIAQGCYAGGMKFWQALWWPETLGLIIARHAKEASHDRT